MRFSDIHMIMIGEEGEYGRRLVRYLETHLSTAIRVYHFTTTERFLAFKERAANYLLDEAFFQRRFPGKIPGECLRTARCDGSADAVEQRTLAEDIEVEGIRMLRILIAIARLER